MKVVVTGGNGFIGSYLCRRLEQMKCEVHSVDNLERGLAGRLSDTNIVQHNIDATDKDALERVFDGADTVFHLAAINGTQNFYDYPLEVLSVGAKSIFAVLEASRNANVKTIITASSAEVYQEPQLIPTPEVVPLIVPDVTNPRYSYGLSKMITEFATIHWRHNDARTISFRPHNVYGPDMGYKHVIPQLIQKVLESNEHGTPIRIHGDGLQTRAFAHVDDIISGLIVLMHNNSASGLFNIGNPEEITIFDLLGIIKKKLNCDADVLYEKDYYTGTNRRCPNIDKISHLGYRPTISIFDGIQPVINWYSKNPVNTTSNIKI